MFKNFFFFLTLAAFPIAVGAQSAGGKDFSDFVKTLINSVINPLVVLVVAAAVLAFFVGILKYVGSGSDESKRKEGANLMWYGIVALFVMVSVWGLVNVLENTFFGGRNTSSPPSSPTLPITPIITPINPNPPNPLLQS